MAYALYTDVATTLGRPITDPDEIKQVNWWITGAELKLRVGDETHPGLGDLAALDVAAVKYVVVEAVARRVRNPGGKQNERIDDYSYGLTANAAAAELVITEAEWALLTPRTEAGAFTIRLGGSPGYARGGW